MGKYFLFSMLTTILLVVINYIIVGKSKYSKTFAIISIIYSVFQIIFDNIYYLNLIKQDDYYISLYSDLIKDLNITFILVTIIELVFLLIIKLKIRFDLYKTITIAVFICTVIYLIVFRGIIITKTIVDMSTFSWILILNYINFINIPLLFIKNRN